MKIITSPDAAHLNQLLLWLEAEQRATGQGFFCNWEVILHAHKENSLYVIEYNAEALGFLAWHGWEPYETINILSIHPKHRLQGMGKLLVDFYLNSAISRNIKKVKVECEPYTSEPFWLSFGFSENEPCQRIKGIPMEKLYLYLAL